MTDIQLTDEELLLLNDGLNKIIKEASNYPEIVKARDLKAKLITAQQSKSQEILEDKLHGPLKDMYKNDDDVLFYHQQSKASVA